MTNTAQWRAVATDGDDVFLILVRKIGSQHVRVRGMREGESSTSNDPICVRRLEKLLTSLPNAFNSAQASSGEVREGDCHMERSTYDRNPYGK